MSVRTGGWKELVMMAASCSAMNQFSSIWVVVTAGQQRIDPAKSPVRAKFMHYTQTEHGSNGFVTGERDE
jgi:hypothetical protein